MAPHRPTMKTNPVLGSGSCDIASWATKSTTTHRQSPPSNRLVATQFQ